MIELLFGLVVIAFIAFLHALPLLFACYILGCAMDRYKKWWKQ